MHEQVEEKLNRKQAAELNASIERIYQKGQEDVRPIHRWLFDEGIENTKARTVRMKKYWVRTLCASSKYHNEAQENMLIGMRNIMRTWATIPD